MENKIVSPQPNGGEIIVEVIKKICEVVCDSKEKKEKK